MNTQTRTTHSNGQAPNRGAKTVAIIGAGIVGVSAALWLQRDGHRVILIDKAGPGEGASHGNGGVLASCSVVPVTVPGLLAKAPKMLLSPSQPLFLKWGYLPRLAPWLIKYLGHANSKDTTRIATALAPIVSDSLADHQALAAGTPAKKWITPSDYLYVYNDRTHFLGDSFGWSLRKAQGFKWDELEGDAFREYDAAFSAELGFAVRLRDHGHIKDPGRYIKDLADYIEANSGKIITAEVTDFMRAGNRVSGVRAGGETIDCDEVVVAAGAWSGSLAAKLGLDVPLETERGYHLELLEPNILPRSPVMIASGKFVATPMAGRLRLAGIVEFGGLDAPPTGSAHTLLKRHVQAAIPGIRWKETKEWMGHRPATTDSIPLIGPVPGYANAWFGFGHHHIGLTGGPKTGRLLAQLITGKKPNIDIEPYLPARFQQRGSINGNRLAKNVLQNRSEEKEIHIK